MNSLKKYETPETAHLSDVVDSICQQNKAADDAIIQEAKPKESKKERRRREKAEKALKKKSKKLIIPKTVQESIPYKRVYPESGIIEVQDGVFCRCYLLKDVNFDDADVNHQEIMFSRWCDFLNSIPLNGALQICGSQQLRNMEDFKRTVLYDMKNEKLDEYREEQNDLRMKDIESGKNNMVKSKYAVIRITAQSYEAVKPIFARIDVDTARYIREIGDAGVVPLSAGQWLEVLHDIYNPSKVGVFGNILERNEKGELVHSSSEKFSFENMKMMGLTTKDVVGPDSLNFTNADYGMVGKTYFRALYVKKFPVKMDHRFFSLLSDVNCRLVASIHYEPISIDKSMNMVKIRLNNAKSQVMANEMKAAKAGYSSDLIPVNVQEAKMELQLQREALQNGQNLFFVTVVIVHFADSLDQLNLDTKAIESVSKARLTDLAVLTTMQENGLNACLPLCNSSLEVKHTMLTESAAIFFPFSMQEMYDITGQYYGINSETGNLILLNRCNAANANGLIVGLSGYGKSVLAKEEILLALLRHPEDQFIILDPEGEYIRLAEALGGEVIHINPSANSHINLFDTDLQDIKKIREEKLDFIVSMFDTILTSACQPPVSPTQRSIIDRCIKNVYEPYLNSMDENGAYDEELLPTLKIYYAEMRRQDGYEAMQLADILETYAVGSLDVFAHKTNVEYHSRLVVYDMKEMGTVMKTMGELVALSNIWNDLSKGRSEGHNVWIYIDEMHLLFRNASSVSFLSNLYKRARKYGGIPTGITQSVSDLLINDQAADIIKNSQFIQMLSQSVDDREALMNLLHISEAQIKHITSAPKGHGLIWDGTHCCPFTNEIPTDTKLYSLVTTKLSEVHAQEQAES